MKLSDAPPLRWGGRPGRYKDFPGAVIRAYDPYSLTGLAFRTDAEVWAWQRVRFDNEVKTVTSKPTKVQAKIEGELLEAKATFTAVLRKGQRVYHLVGEAGPASGQLRLLRSIAERNGSVVALHQRESLLADSKLNARLARLRQASVIHLRDGPACDPLIVAAVRDGALSRSRLCQVLSQFTAQLIDGRVAQLHCAGVLVMEPACDDYTVQLRSQTHV